MSEISKYKSIKIKRKINNMDQVMDNVKVKMFSSYLRRKLRNLN